MKRCIVIGGAPIKNYEYIKKQLNKDDYFIYGYSGLKHACDLGYNPNKIIGDFDSFEKPSKLTNVIVLPCEKDDTDTMYAIKYAIKEGFKEFILLGVIGLRIDHTLGNLAALLYIDNEGCNGKIIDDFSEIEIVGKNAKYVADQYKYFSILSIGDIISGVSIENAKYPLNEAQITNYYPLGVSNEVIEGKTSKIQIKEGKAYLIKVF